MNNVMTYKTLSALSVKGLCIVIRHNDKSRNRLNAAEMLHARVIESWAGMPDYERQAVMELARETSTSADIAA